MPSIEHYKQARALPATPAGKDRAAAGAIRHSPNCRHNGAADTPCSNPEHADRHHPAHPAENGWAPPEIKVHRPKRSSKPKPRPKRKPWHGYTGGNPGPRPSAYHPSPHPDRNPKLPPTVTPYQYQKLIDAKAQLVLADFDPDTGRKPPVQEGWNKLWPDLSDVYRHLENYPNAVIGVIPASVGAVVVDVDQGDWRDLSDILPQALSNGTRKRKGRHLWCRLADADRMPKDTGFEIPDLCLKGDIRCAEGYVVLWNKKSVTNALRMAELSRNGAAEASAPSAYPAEEMEQYRSRPESWGDSSDWCERYHHYAAYYDAQTSAAFRRNHKAARALQARELSQQGWSKSRIARRFGRSVRTVERWLSEDEDLSPIHPPWVLAEQARAERVEKIRRALSWEERDRGRRRKPGIWLLAVGSGELVGWLAAGWLRQAGMAVDAAASWVRRAGVPCLRPVPIQPPHANVAPVCKAEFRRCRGFRPSRGPPCRTGFQPSGWYRRHGQPCRMIMGNPCGLPRYPRTGNYAAT